MRSLPYALAVFLMTLYTRADGVVIKVLLPDGDFEAGVYAAGYRILDSVNMVAFLFAVLLLPMFSREQDSPAGLRRLLDESVRYMAFLVIPLTTLSVVFSTEVVTLLYAEATRYWGVVFALLISTFITTGTSYIFGTLLTALGRVRSMNVVYGVTVGLNILLNFILIPRYHAAGAAVATIATQVFAVGGIVILCLRTVDIGLPRASLIRLVLFAGVCVVVVIGIGRFLFPGDWMISFPVMALLMLLGAMALGVFRISEMKALLSSR
jgi:O-antigen/teichoic acid export membrane protein